MNGLTLPIISQVLRRYEAMRETDNSIASYARSSVDVNSGIFCQDRRDLTWHFLRNQVRGRLQEVVDRIQIGRAWTSGARHICRLASPSSQRDHDKNLGLKTALADHGSPGSTQATQHR
jgi:hypothetical protein